MSSIITITFSPCIDKSATVAELIPEKKLRCTSLKLEPGGGGINVARAIKKLDGEATAIFPSGGYTGKFFNHLLEKENVSSIIIETENETRENIVILEKKTNQQFRFGMPGTELKETEWQQCLKALEEAKDVEFIVASGSLPPGVPLDIYGQLAVMAKKGNAKLVVDTSGEALRFAAREGVYLLKPNLGELSSLMGIERIDVEKIEDIGKQVIAKGHCRVLVVSMGDAGAILITKDEIYRAAPPKVRRQSTVGAGDSMVAGMILSLSQSKSLKEVLLYGIACGTAATMNSGTELCKKEDAEKLFYILKNQY